MPRQAEIDVPDALHHIICRGIERRQMIDADDPKLSVSRQCQTLNLNRST